MHKECKHLIQTLRDELQQNAELYVRLDEQYELVTRRAQGDLDECAQAIEIQGANVQMARRNRELARQAVAGSLQFDPEVSIEAMLPLLPEPWRRPVRSLLESNCKLSSDVLRTIRRNQAVLARLLDRERKHWSGGCRDKFDACAAPAPQTDSSPLIGLLPADAFRELSCQQAFRAASFAAPADAGNRRPSCPLDSTGLS